ncbi:MAG: AmmeMemoRadiSam system radical SAM enzyme [Sphaerochaetaceae bacterium]|nr:AmmeMemoRadiSam system radical SAM enzyme [Sphaerochaetaceae bacterium]
MKTTLQCDFCWRLCTLEEGALGVCGIRKHQDGEMRTLGYGEIVASGVDPIEKKPLYHFFPGSQTFSIALFGCNYTCSFCQNYHISQIGSPYWPGRKDHQRQFPVTAESVVDKMNRTGTNILSYTYSEPVVWQDYMLAVAEQVHDHHGFNCMITNGSFSKSSLQRVLPAIDAFNIDVKGNDAFYRSHCNGVLKPVLDAVETIAATPNKILEITTLLIEGIHTAATVKTLAHQLADRGVQVWHLSRFYPHYHMADAQQTSEPFLKQMLEIAQDSGIPYIYAGNSRLEGWDTTRCPSCRLSIITTHNNPIKARKDVQMNIKDNRCKKCGFELYGRFS